MYNEQDELVDDLRQVMDDLGVSNIDDAPYDVLNEIDTNGYVDMHDLTDLADRIYG